MKADVPVYLIMGIVLLLMVFGGSLYMTTQGKEGVKDITLLNKIQLSCTALMLKDQKCEHFNDDNYEINWNSDATKIEYKGEKLTLKKLCEKAFSTDTLRSCQKQCSCPESVTIPSSLPTVSKPSQGECTLTEKSFDGLGIVGETDTVSLVLTATNCKGCYISPYGDPNYLEYVSKSSESVPSDSAEILTIYKCKSVVDAADLGIQVRSDTKKGIVCATADAKPQIFKNVKCVPAGTPTPSFSTSEKTEIEVVFTSFTESFTKEIDCSNNDKCKKSIIKIECDDISPLYIWAEKVNDKLEVGASDSEDIYPAIVDIDNKEKDCTLLESGALVKGIYGELSKYVCNTIKSWKDSTPQVHVKITKPTDCSSWKVGSE